MASDTLNSNSLHQSPESTMPRRRSLRLLTSTPEIPVPPSLRKSPYLKSPLFSQGLPSPTLPSEEDEIWLQDTIPIAKPTTINPAMIATEGGSPLSAKGNMDRRGSIVQVSRKVQASQGLPAGQTSTLNFAPPSISAFMSSPSIAAASRPASGRERYAPLSPPGVTAGSRPAFSRRWSANPAMCGSHSVSVAVSFDLEDANGLFVPLHHEATSYRQGSGSSPGRAVSVGSSLSSPSSSPDAIQSVRVGPTALGPGRAQPKRFFVACLK